MWSFAFSWEIPFFRSMSQDTVRRQWWHVTIQERRQRISMNTTQNKRLHRLLSQDRCGTVKIVSIPSVSDFYEWLSAKRKWLPSRYVDNTSLNDWSVILWIWLVKNSFKSETRRVSWNIFSIFILREKKKNHSSTSSGKKKKRERSWRHSLSLRLIVTWSIM